MRGKAIASLPGWRSAVLPSAASDSYLEVYDAVPQAIPQFHPEYGPAPPRHQVLDAYRLVLSIWAHEEGMSPGEDPPCYGVGDWANWHDGWSEVEAWSEWYMVQKNLTLALDLDNGGPPTSIEPNDGSAVESNGDPIWGDENSPCPFPYVWQW